MPLSLDQLVDQAAAEARSKSLVVSWPKLPAPAPSAGAKVSFCQYWPIAKPVLETLATFIPAAAFLIRIVISIGDKACP